MADIVIDADGEMVFGLCFVEFGKHGPHHCGREFFGGEPVASTDHARHSGKLTIRETLKHRRDDILIERFARTARFFGAIQNRDGFDARWQRLEEVFDRKRTVQPHAHHADFFAARDEVLDGFLNGFTAGTHDHNDPFGIGRTSKIEWTIMPSGQDREPIHRARDDFRHGLVVRIDRLASLKVHVRVLCGATNRRMVWRQASSAMLAHQTIIDHRPDVVGLERFDFGNLVRGAKSVEHVQKRHAGLERRGVRDQG